MLEIYFYGKTEKGFLDLRPGTSLDMENFTPLFDEDLTAGEFSLPIDIEWTEKNRRLMGFAERLQNFDDLQPYWMVDVYNNGFPELVHAKLTVLEKSGDLGFVRGSFNASISGNKGLFGSSIKNKTLRNIDLGADITWAGDESRQFAQDLMNGLYPQYSFIGFAPVVNENFFDQNKNYNGEFLAEDTLNNIVHMGTGTSNWVFGRPTSADATVPTIAGDEEHIDYRTVPFFKFQWVLARAFEAAGYTAQCDIITNPAFADMYMFNNVALEFYTMAVYADYNRKIIPANHMPDIALVDFFRMVFSAFNLYPVFSGNNNIDVYYRHQVFTNRQVADVTGRCAPFFSAVYKDASESNGYALDYEWESGDDYYTDRVKEIDEAAVCASVTTIPELATLDIGRPLTTDDIVFVTAENMYYKCANALSIPTLWDAWSERLQAYKTGNGERSVSIGVSTLCNYVGFDETDALYVRKPKLATRQMGSYWNNKFVQIKNDFGLRLFYITKQLVDTNLVPVSFNHSTDPAGTIIATYSLALQGSSGLAANFHKNWQDAQSSKSAIKITMNADAKLMKDMEDNNTLQINNVLYLVSKIERSIPLGRTITVDMLPL